MDIDLVVIDTEFGAIADGLVVAHKGEAGCLVEQYKSLYEGIVLMDADHSFVCLGQIISN